MQVLQFEELSDMKKRIGSCGATPQILAVEKGVKAIRAASGCLDEGNAATALFHLAVAISGTKNNAKRLIQYTACMAEETTYY